MFRHNRALAASLLIVLGFAIHAAGQTGSPATAYRQDGKWVGYVPPHLRYARPDKSSGLFRSPLPDIASCLAGSPTGDVEAAVAVEAVEESEDAFDSALLGSEATPPQPHVLSTAFDESSLTAEPEPMMVDSEFMVGQAMPAMGEPCVTACEPSPVACAPPRFYGRAEYLAWWLNGMDVLPLVTTSPDRTPQGEAGVLGQPGTSILFGGSNLDSDVESGGRFTLGLWLDPCQKWGVEFTYFTVGSLTSSFGASADDYSILARPFYNVEDGQQDARLIAYEDFVTGSVTASASTQFEGGEVLFRQSVQRECWAEIDLLVGYRWAQLDDGVLVQESTEALGGAAPGTAFELFDRFDTENTFNGAELGMSIRRQLDCCWSVELLGKIGLGNMNSVAVVDGETITIATTGTAVTAGGLLAQPTNIGAMSKTASQLPPNSAWFCGVSSTTALTSLSATPSST
jgi:hypothetical protein